MLDAFFDQAPEGRMARKLGITKKEVQDLFGEFDTVPVPSRRSRNLNHSQSLSIVLRMDPAVSMPPNCSSLLLRYGFALAGVKSDMAGPQFGLIWDAAQVEEALKEMDADGNGTVDLKEARVRDC